MTSRGALRDLLALIGWFSGCFALCLFLICCGFWLVILAGCAFVVIGLLGLVVWIALAIRDDWREFRNPTLARGQSAGDARQKPSSPAT